MTEMTVGDVFYPLFVDLKGRKVVVVGGGKVAERKVSGLLSARAAVLLVSPEITPTLQSLFRQRTIQHHPRSFKADDLDDAWLVIAATDDPDVQKAVFMESRKRRIFCNVADQPALCSFIVPSTVRRGDLCIAISTAGKSPALAKRIRLEIEGSFGACYADYVSLLGELRQLVLKRSHESPARHDLCASLAEPGVLAWMESRQWGKVRQWAVSRCGDGAAEIVDRYALTGEAK